MEEFRQIYNTISDYVTNPTVLKVASGVLAGAGIACFYLAGRILKSIIIEESGLEKNLKE